MASGRYCPANAPAGPQGIEAMMNYVPAGDTLALASEISGEDEHGFARIGEVAKEFGVTLRALRFYEDKGLLDPKRDGSTRLYSARDLSRLRLVLLGRRVGFSLREVKQMLDLYDPRGTNSRQLRLVLDKSERQMVRLERQRSLIDEAMRDLGSLIDEARKRLTRLQSGGGA